MSHENHIICQDAINPTPTYLMHHLRIYLYFETLIKSHNLSRCNISHTYILDIQISHIPLFLNNTLNPIICQDAIYPTHTYWMHNLRIYLYF